MKQYAEFLRVLAAHVYGAQVGGLLLHDAADFKAWLLQCAAKVGKAASLEQFFSEIE